MDYSEHFKSKKITLMGLGLLGRGVGDAKFLAKQGADLIVTDMKTEDQLKDSVDQLREYKNIIFKLGGHDLEDFIGRDLIVKGAMVPLENKYIEEAQGAGIPVTMSTALVAKLSPATIVGVTGTKGKSTVTSLIYHILSKNLDRVFLGGNVRGVSTLEMLPDLKEGDILVLELDSWQLQGFGYEKISPHISVFTNLLPDHMNYYKGDMGKYFDDKANIFKFQTKDDHLIVPASLVSMVNNQKINLHVVDGGGVTEQSETLLGEHNRENIAFASKAAELLGISKEKSYAAINDFPGLPGRLQKLREVGGVTFYNDNNSTVPVSTIAGIKAMVSKGNVILIAGGAYKDVDPVDLADAMSENLKSAVLMPGTGTDKLLEYDLNIPVTEVSTLENAVDIAHKNSKPGDIILFSPAFASFGMFKNEFERGDLYDLLVGDLK